MRLKKYWVAGFLVLFFSTVNPVTAATEQEKQIAMTQATHTAIANLEAALQTVTANKLDEAQGYIDATRDSASDILGRCSIEAKKNAVLLRLEMRGGKSRTVIQRGRRFL